MLWWFGSLHMNAWCSRLTQSWKDWRNRLITNTCTRTLCNMNSLYYCPPVNVQSLMLILCFKSIYNCFLCLIHMLLWKYQFTPSPSPRHNSVLYTQDITRRKFKLKHCKCFCFRHNIHWITSEDMNQAADLSYYSSNTRETVSHDAVHVMWLYQSNRYNCKRCSESISGFYPQRLQMCVFSKSRSPAREHICTRVETGGNETEKNLEKDL